jgi:hypothetical protein
MEACGANKKIAASALAAIANGEKDSVNQALGVRRLITPPVQLRLHAS